MRSQLAWAPQEPDWGSLTVREALERPFTFRANQTKTNGLERLPDWMARFDMPEALLNQRCDTLSGGEKQRLGLVSALLLDRPILLLDEITSALDEGNRERVRSWLRELNGPTVLAVSHDAGVERWAGRMIDMDLHHA